MLSRIVSVAVLAAISCTTPMVSAAPFIYQGRLTDNGTAPDGLYDLRFRLFDSAVGGSQIGPTFTEDDAMVVAGVFQVQLDFGDVFAGPDRWLAVEVRPGASGAPFTPLTPRQAILPTPKAQHALAADTVLNPQWTEAPGVLSYGDGTDRVFINRSSPITSAEYFGVFGDGIGFVGMYVAGAAGSSPFYGYSVDGQVSAYSYYSPSQDRWNLYKGGIAMFVDADNDLVAVNDVVADNFRFSQPKTRRVSVSGNVFTSPVGEYQAAAGQGGAYMSDPIGAWMIAPVNLPDGAVVTGMTLHCRDLVVGELSMRLAFQTHNGPGSSTISEATTSGLNGDSLTILGSPPANAVIDHSSRHYYLRAFSASWPGNSNMRISSVVIEYEIDEAN